MPKLPLEDKLVEVPEPPIHMEREDTIAGRVGLIATTVVPPAPTRNPVISTMLIALTPKAARKQTKNDRPTHRDGLITLKII